MEENKLQDALTKEEKRLQAAYYYLGREYDQLLREGKAPQIPGLEYLLEKAGEFRTNIESLRAQLAEPADREQPPAGGFCTNCGAAVTPGAVYCTNCGAKQ